MRVRRLEVWGAHSGEPILGCPFSPDAVSTHGPDPENTPFQPKTIQFQHPFMLRSALLCFTPQAELSVISEKVSAQS